MIFDYQAAITAARREHNWASFPVVILDPWAEFLANTPGNVKSQNGEDGLLAALFEKIGTRNKWCFEVGAHDGEYLSNTWALREIGWKAVLIEADEGHYKKLQENYGDRCNCIHQRIGTCDLDRVLFRVLDPGPKTPKVNGFPWGPDLGVIDIDGDDLYVWQCLDMTRPRVMLVEYNTSGQDGMLGGYPGTWQAGPDSVMKVGRKKGYRALVKTACNLLFLDESEISNRQGLGDLT